ncbi:MAG: FAD-dependent oxidoreductase [Deltaproteobacteria bacterium]|nr:FAD-dependent oxidoreductase [Deltaproteobacteria bacterium]
MKRQRILIVGGVAGGASAAARARRLNEDADIVVFDRGEHVSFANCGLPYFIGNVIEDEESLLLATPDLFAERFAIEVRTRSEVLAIDVKGKSIRVRNLSNGDVYEENYDDLVLSPGAKPVKPPLPGIDHERVFSLRNIPDSRHIKAAAKEARNAVVIGAGFIGLEMAENLQQLGLKVTLVELADQVMPPFDAEMAVLVENRLKEKGIDVILGHGANEFIDREGHLDVVLSNGDVLEGDLVLLSIGVKPETTLAKEAGLELGKRGGILVDEYMHTSAPSIWAVGDAIEVHDLLTDNWMLVPLAGPANRQGRIVAENIVGKDGSHEVRPFRGVQGTAVIGVYGLAAAATGASEKSLQRAKIEYECIYLHPCNHAGYYPGATSIAFKLLFSPLDGKILGAQAVGEQGVERRIDVISMAMQMGGSIYDLEEAELAYAPQFGAAKDPVNLAGMIAANVLRGDLPLAKWEDLADTPALLVDVRTEEEFAEGHLEASVNIPLNVLRVRAGELPSDREIWLICAAGQRAYNGIRMLRQMGLNVRNLPGGLTTYEAFKGARLL